MQFERQAVKALLPLLAVAFAAFSTYGEVEFDFGAWLRIREEMMDNVPGLPGGGCLSRAPRGDFTNHLRFRPTLWGEMKGMTDGGATWRLYTRFTDEFRWCPEPHKHNAAFPGEVTLENLFLETKGLFDGFLDFKIGRQDLWGFYDHKLDHVFQDGTPGDGSRTTYSDMVDFTMHVTEESKIDLIALYNFDNSDVRWGTDSSRFALTSVNPAGDPEMDDWGFGAVWDSNFGEAIPYRVFWFEKNTSSFHVNGVKHPHTRHDTLGFALEPRLDEEWTIPLEVMWQVGRNGEGDFLSAWSGYAGVEWKSSRPGWRPFASATLRYMSGDENAAEEDGGHHAWDPMWCRSVCECELFLYGTHYGVAWWSNMYYEKNSFGIDFGPRHRLETWIGPIFAAEQDGLGNGGGMFKGFLSVIRYDFPLKLADRTKNERFEIFGHVYAELFNPGDYYESDKPAWFFRWQVEFRF